MGESGRTLVLEAKEGPVTIRSDEGAGIDKEYDLTEEIRVQEEFASTTDSAFYFVRLKMQALSEQGLIESEKKLIEAYRRLCYLWPFCGGNNMRCRTRAISVRDSFKTNMEELRASFLKERGLRPFSLTTGLNAAWSGTYERPPLMRAVALYRHLDSDVDLADMLKYYYEARGGDESWYTPLYKVREVLARPLHNERAARSALGISGRKWTKFGQSLNDIYDRRHAVCGSADMPVATKKPDWELIETARRWIESYLQYKGIGED